MRARRAVPAVALAAIAAFTLMGASVLGRTDADGTAAQEPPPRKVRIAVKDNYFEPRSVEVRERGHVGWKWRGQNRHNVRFTKVPKGASRKGSRTRTDGYWKRRFRRPGVYRYVCRVWAGMRGTVTVRSLPEPLDSARRR